MLWSASVLSQLSSDTEPTIVVTFDSAKYVFNVGENTGRVYTQSVQRQTKTRAVFLSSLGTQRASGLPGFIMGLSDLAGVPKIDIIGPEGLNHLLASMRTYLFRDKLALTSRELPTIPSAPIEEPTPAFKDQNITVYGVPILPYVPITNADSENAASVSELKRKRSSSPVGSPAKRASLGDRPLTTSSHRAAPREPYIPPISPLLRSMLLQRDRSPPSGKVDSSPAGGGLSNKADRRSRASSPPTRVQQGSPPDDPTEHRQSMISWMFSKTPEPVPSDLDYVPKPTPRGPKRKQKRFGLGHESSPAVGAPPPQRGPLPIRPAGFNARLPRFDAYKDPLTGKASDLKRPVLSWVVVGPAVRGRFDAQRAEELGLKSGPLRGRLIAGHPVTIKVPDGSGGEVERTIQPEECVGPTEPPKVVIILDVPTVEHIAPLAGAFGEGTWFERFRLEQKEERQVHVVFHLLGDGVLEDPRYRDFMNSFPSDVHHAVSSRQHNPDRLTFTSAGFNQLRLNHLDPQIFPLPKFNASPNANLDSLVGYPPKISPLYPDMLVDVRPPEGPKLHSHAKGNDRFHPTVSSPGRELEDLPEETRQLYTRLKEEIASTPLREPESGENVRIIPLGTSSAVPSKYRNVSSTLVMTPEHGNMLLDAGEGTFGQLARFFGTEEAESESVWKVLRDLRCISLSHVHGDHHIGLVKLLAMRQKLHPYPIEPLYVIAPSNILKYIYEYSDIEDLGLNQTEPGSVRVIASEIVHGASSPSRENSPQWYDHNTSRANLEAMINSLGLTRFQTVEMNHGCRCFGCVISHKDGWSIAFSGDTRPTQKLVDAAKDVTVLIHEATMSDSEHALAKQKMHSTIGEAIGVGAQMNASHILLTHFSARIPQGRPGSVQAHTGTVSYALDHVNLRVADMWKMAHYLPAVKQTLVAAGEEEEDEITAHSVSW